MGIPSRFAMLCAVHLFLIRDDQVLLLRLYNTGYEDGNYSVIAGHLDGDEEVVDAIVREAGEEAGISLNRSDLRIAGVMHRMSNDERVDFFVVAEQWTGDIRNLEPEKCDDLSWFPLDALPANTIPYVRRALSLLGDGCWFDSYGWEDPVISR